MLNFKSIYFFAAVVFLIPTSCIKSISTGQTSALNLINAISTSNSIIPIFDMTEAHGQVLPTFQYFSSAVQIPFGTSYELGSYTGLTNLAFYQMSDTNAIIWSGAIALRPGSINSLFLCGDTSKVDTLGTADILPTYGVSDSNSSVRIVDLVTGNSTLKVFLQGGNASNADFKNLNYKSVTSFKEYPANSASPGSYTFEIVDQFTDSVLSTFTWVYTYQRNNSIIIAGSGTSGINAFQINNF